MTVRRTILSLGLCLALCGTKALAGAPMGPAMATLESGQWSISFEYAHENIDLAADGHSVESLVGGGSQRYSQSFAIDELESNMFLGRLTYGLSNTWDVFVRVGLSDAKDDLEATGPGIISGTNGQLGFDGSHGLTWGIGTRATFWSSGPWGIAGLAQVTWMDPDDSDFRLTVPGASNQAVVGEGELDYLQSQFSLALMYQENSWGVWIGPFVQLVDGDLDLDAQFVIDGATQGNLAFSGDLEEESMVGGHAGAAYAISDSLACWIEGQFTADSWLLGIGGIIRIE
ncbi:MAG: hypothetical protein JSW27_05335 [Phycisphaerales bacterium]|nr:MAG: hypothetical protein JSW27_05335 [Phycisphaerales bacterium]